MHRSYVEINNLFIFSAISFYFINASFFLSIVAKKSSLFDDKALEIQELTYIIKNDINSLNKRIAQLQEICKSRKHAQGKHMESHSNSVVVSLQSKLASMSNNFRGVLEVRTEVRLSFIIC